MDLMQVLAIQTFRWLKDDGPRKMMSSMQASRARQAEAERKQREAEEKPDRDAFAFAIEEERKRMLAEDKRVKGLSEDAQRKLAEEVLRKHLPERISAIDTRLNKVEQNLKRKEAALAAAVAKQKSAIAEQKESDERMASFEKSAKDAVRLNAFYQEYLAACGNNGELDDIGEFIVREAAQKAGVTNEEMADVRKFAAAHGFDKTVTYRSMPAKPDVVDKRAEISKLKEKADGLARVQEEALEEKRGLLMVKSALQRRLA